MIKDLPINPITGFHTQGIETHWGHVKTKIIRQMRGTTKSSIPGHLAEYRWKKFHNKTPLWDVIAEIVIAEFHLFNKIQPPAL